MRKLKFYIVDVFTSEKYSGNQLAVFINNGNITDEEMQAIAREINFSETTFVEPNPIDKCTFKTRIFTPKEEVPFAGHPTLGTAFILWNQIIKRAQNNIVLDMKAGLIPISIKEDILWMQQIQPDFDIKLEPNIIANVLGLNTQSIDTSFPTQIVSTGLPHIIVPLTSINNLKNININKKAYFDLVNEKNVKCILAFSTESYNDDTDLSVRVFADYFGVPEDPATGSGNGALAAYLSQYSVLNTKDINIKTAQGYEINRPSILFLRTKNTANTIDVFIGGHVVKIAEGYFN